MMLTSTDPSRAIVEAEREQLLLALNRINPKLLDNGELKTYEWLKEEMSDQDWVRFGTVAGLLWFKIDAILSSLKDLNNTAKDGNRELEKTALRASR